ncbi:Glycine/D-amino acid oxidase [Variovorax sp. YR750]|uniref:NAD(P)/FAD-dependent oxidoreductase n=1 Tax=Variovorax sp. YR750 TaxID=1884384 RepID=UPI0008BA15E7|nr:FAD-dependent oxidoreductase [Variovorax sp. YR750]SEM03903.1 Glycine/D-amino acid oxidase [Variovorax sp. YR750]
MTVREVDTLILGGGVVGVSVGYGLACAGERVRVLDEGDDAFRAARGNFGLVWVQGKGVGNTDYARWTMAAAKHWPNFAQDLTAVSGVDLELSQIGGLTICLNEGELTKRVASLESIRSALEVPYPYEVLDAQGLRALSPFIGPEVVGAVYCPLDGHVSPLRLLRALFRGFEIHGGQMVPGVRCERIEHKAGEFHVWAGGVEHVAGRVVLAAGLGNRELAPMVGLSAPIEPNRGQILVTERMQPFLRHPSGQVRQTGEGVVQIGDSKEDVGLDDGTTLEQLARIAERARRIFPILADVNVVRTWGALRVMTPDGFPIYQESHTCPGAFLITCHSGITLASMHASSLVTWMRGGAEPSEIQTFKSERFDV